MVAWDSEHREHIADAVVSSSVQVHFQRNLVRLSVSVRVLCLEGAQNLCQFFQCGGRFQIQVVQPGLIDKIVGVGIDVLSHQIAHGISMSVGSHEARGGVGILRVYTLHISRHIFGNRILQRNQNLLGNAILLIINRSITGKNDVRIFSRSKHQIQLCLPVRLDDFPFNMNACLFFQSYKGGHFLRGR